MRRFLLAVVLLLSGCATAIYPNVHMPMTSPINTNIEEVNLRVEWYTSGNDLRDICIDLTGKNSQACATYLIFDGGKKSICTLRVLKPKDFNEIDPLAIVGHELLHCFGANHP